MIIIIIITIMIYFICIAFIPTTTKKRVHSALQFISVTIIIVNSVINIGSKCYKNMADMK